MQIGTTRPLLSISSKSSSAQPWSFRCLRLTLWAIVLALPGVLAAQSATTPQRQAQPGYQPISNTERLNWFAKSTVGPKSLGAGVVSAGWGTARNKPEEYGPHWKGFAKRYGMRLTGVATGNAIEAGLGMAWNEDPRYFRSEQDNPWERVRHAATMTVMAYRSDGTMAPAYARYSGIAGGNFLSNTWRVSSESSAGAALTRTAIGFAGRFVSNIFDEFWSDAKDKLRRK